jgi:hypothetical protein
MIKYTTTFNELKNKLNQVNPAKTDLLQRTEKSIMLIKDATSELEFLIRENGFRSQQDEIHFFRHIKPEINSLGIAYTIIQIVESQRPTSSKEGFQKLIEQKLEFVRAHYVDFPEFISYYNSSSTIKDDIFFLRTNVTKQNMFPQPFDAKYSTGYDLIAAYALAYKFLANHFQQSTGNGSDDLPDPKMQWTKQKVAFGELLYALKNIKAINNGNTELSVMSRSLGKLLNIEIGDPYKTFNEIRSRKEDRLRFLKQMIFELEMKMDELDE